jgi:hypothetical protein
MADAAHFSNFLDPLQAQVSGRLTESEITSGERRTLTRAQQLLDRSTKSLRADASLLGVVASSLRSVETDSLTQAESDAVEAFVSEGNAELGELQERTTIGSNPPRLLAIQFNRVASLLNRANDSNNSIPIRARAVAAAWNRLRSANLLANRLVKAPASLGEQTVELVGRESDREKLLISLHTDGSYLIASHGQEPDEVGTWDYVRTTPNTATVTLSTTATTLKLRFTSPRRGLFTAREPDETAHGRFFFQQ